VTSSLLDEDDERREQKPMDRAPSSIVQQARANSICLLRDGSLATFGHASETVDRKDINDGYAVDFRYDILRKKTPWPAQASWRTSAVLAWFSCEGNIHHFFRETLYPIWEQVGVPSICQTHMAEGLTTAKLDSVLLKLNEFGHATQQLVDQVLASSKHLQSAVI
jgi:hypothetical protein